MAYQHDAQIANIVTSYCTCLAGIMPLIFTKLTRPQPPRWLAVYACILITGIPTVWLHAVEGNRLASFFDVGTNILLAYALEIAVSGDFMTAARRRVFLTIMTVINLAVWAWLAYEVFAPEKKPVITFGAFGEFYAGETALILNAWVVVILMFRNHRHIPAKARPLFYLVVLMFLSGMFLATASNRQITAFIIPWHAVWHIVGAFGFITFWLFNHVRFQETPSA